MLADASITLGNDEKTRYQIAIELSIKDRDQLVRVCHSIGLDPFKISERTRAIEGVEYEMASITFTCKEMVQDLRNLGYFEFKEGGRLSSFDSFSYSVQKALLLGFFDGDGIQGRSQICGSNIQLLYQIEEFYNIKYEVATKVDIDADYINNNPIHPRKNLYGLHIGAALFNDLLITMNFQLSNLIIKTNEYCQYIV